MASEHEYGRLEGDVKAAFKECVEHRDLLQEVREVLEGLRWKTPEIEPCWCRVRINGLHDDECQRARALMEKLEVK